VPVSSPGSRMSRTITLVLLSAVMLSACCCLVTRRPEPQYDENGNPIPYSQTSYHRSWSLWPMWWSGGRSSRYWGSGVSGSSIGGAKSGSIGGVKTGGFGSLGAKFGGGGIS
jgi:hypothetical protein